MKADAAARADSDEALVAQCLAGDSQAFELLFVRHHARVFRVSVRILKDRQSALDAVQETFIRAPARLGQYTGQGTFGGWLARITANLAVDGLRRRRRHERHETLSAAAEAATVPWEGPRPDQATEASRLRRALESAMARLPPMQRIVLVMKEIEGLSCEEIATALRCSVGTMMSRLHYARRKLQWRLARWSGGAERSPGDRVVYRQKTEREWTRG